MARFGSKAATLIARFFAFRYVSFRRKSLDNFKMKTGFFQRQRLTFNCEMELEAFSPPPAHKLNEFLPPMDDKPPSPTVEAVETVEPLPQDTDADSPSEDEASCFSYCAFLVETRFLLLIFAPAVGVFIAHRLALLQKTFTLNSRLVCASGFVRRAHYRLHMIFV